MILAPIVGGDARYAGITANAASGIVRIVRSGRIASPRASADNVPRMMSMHFRIGRRRSTVGWSIMSILWSDTRHETRDRLVSRCLFFGHERIPVIRRRRERLLDRPRAHPAHEIALRSRLVVRARAARAAERLLPNHRARRLVVDVKVSGR